MFTPAIAFGTFVGINLLRASTIWVGHGNYDVTICLRYRTRSARTPRSRQHPSSPGERQGSAKQASAPVSAVFENLEAGATIDEIVEQFDISREQITSGITFGRYRRKRVSYL
jgi:hypothetical protein